MDISKEPTRLPPVQPIWIQGISDRHSYPRLSGDQTATHVVIGGGISGILTAYRLAQAGQPVTLLEEARLLNGDTGYTTAFVSRVPDAPLKELAARFGLEKLRAVWQAAAVAQAWMRETVQREQFDCDWVDCNSYVLSWNPHDQVLAEEFAIMQQLDPGAQLVTPATDSHVPAGAAAAIRLPNEAHMHIRKLLLGLVKTKTGKQINIFEDSKVSGLHLHARGVTVQTAEAVLEAERVFVATGFPGLLPELGKKMHSDITYVMAADCPKEAPLTFDAFWDTDQPYQYFRRVNEKTMLLGGADHPVGTKGNPDQTHQALAAFLKAHFPAAGKITHRWSGRILKTGDGLPAAGWMPGTERIGVITGLIGSGMVYSSLSSSILCDLALQRQPAAADILTPARFNLPAMTLDAKPEAGPARAVPESMLRWLLPLVPLAVLLYAWYVFFAARSGAHIIVGLDFKTAALVIFPVFGLTAFTLVWIQLMIGSLMPWWRRVYPGIERYHRYEGPVVLFFMTLHPLTILAGAGLSGYFHHTFIRPNQVIWIWFSYTALLVAYGTVTTALLRKWKYVQRWWRKVHVLNYVVFWAAWIHSWNIGSDVRTTGLKYVWLFFGVTVGVAMVRRFWPHRVAVSSIPAKSQPAENFVKVATLDQIQPDQPLCCSVQGRQIALFNLAGHIYALDNVCNHADGPLCEGFVDGNVVECPLHASRFDIRTGALLEGPATKPQPAFKVRVEGNDVEVAV